MKPLDHETYMREALKQAKKAYHLGEVPIGCVIVYRGTESKNIPSTAKELHMLQNKLHNDETDPTGIYPGKIIGRGYNRRNTDKSVLAHAEISAIRKAGKAIGDWRLEDCILYVTLEPCQMCAGAIVQARIPAVVMGCMNPKAGCGGSVLNILEMPEFNHQVQVTRGVLEDDCSNMLSSFFQDLRIRSRIKKQDESRSS